MSRQFKIQQEPMNIDTSDYSFQLAKAGGLTCRCSTWDGEFLLHSVYNPIQEAKRTMEAQLQVSQEPFERVIVYGFGCGHHLRILLGHPMLAGKSLEVWETNVRFFHEVTQQAEVQDLLQHPRLNLLVSDQISDYQMRMKSWERERPMLIVHDPSLRLTPQGLQEFREALARYKVFLNNLASFQGLFEENFQANIQNARADVRPWVGAFQGVPFVMVSAGPSLEKHLECLEELKQHALLACVGTALKPLLKAGVRPDLCMITDPKSLVLEQLESVDAKELPLFYLSTANQGVVTTHTGPSFFVYQEGYEPAEKLARDRGAPLIQTGGSVSTALFELLRVLGANPLCLIGQDLAFTNSKSHVAGAHDTRNVVDLQGREQVQNFWQNGTVPTIRNLLMYRDFLQRRAATATVKLYNATEGGAYIAGFEHVTLQSFLQQMKSFDAEPVRRRVRELAGVETP